MRLHKCPLCSFTHTSLNMIGQHKRSCTGQTAGSLARRQASMMGMPPSSDADEEAAAASLSPGRDSLPGDDDTRSPPGSGASGCSHDATPMEQEPSPGQAVDAAEAAAAAASAESANARAATRERQLRQVLNDPRAQTPRVMYSLDEWHWIQMSKDSQWSRKDAARHLANEAEVRRAAGQPSLRLFTQADINRLLDGYTADRGMEFSPTDVVFADGSNPFPRSDANKGAAGTVCLTAYQRSSLSVLRDMFTDLASDSAEHREATPCFRDGERVFGAPITGTWLEAQQARVRAIDPNGYVFSFDIFHDKSEKFGRSFYPVYIVSNHLSLDEKRNPINWRLVALWPILHFDQSPPLGETQKRRQRANYITALLDTLLRTEELTDAMQNGMDIGDARVWPILQLSILDHPEKCQDAKCNQLRCKTAARALSRFPQIDGGSALLGAPGAARQVGSSRTTRSQC